MGRCNREKRGNNLFYFRPFHLCFLFIRKDGTETRMRGERDVTWLHQDLLATCISPFTCFLCLLLPVSPEGWSERQMKGKTEGEERRDISPFALCVHSLPRGSFLSPRYISFLYPFLSFPCPRENRIDTEEGISCPGSQGISNCQD